MSNLPVSIEAIEDALRAMAEAAAEKTLPLFRTTLSIENKLATGFDPVTEADREAETAIRAIITARFPEHAVIGEEWGRQGSGPCTWIIDPVDGTRAFISGVPVWGTLVGFYLDGRAVAGLMSQPFIGECFFGFPGRAVYERAGQASTIRTSGVRKLVEAKIFTTTPTLFSAPGQAEIWMAFAQATRLQRFGCDCYGYALVAAGHADLVIEPRLNIYDIAALIPIIEGAGGAIACWDGSRPEQGGDIVAAATPQLLEEALELIARTGR